MKQKWSVLSNNALSKLFLYTSSTIVAINFTFNFNSPHWLPSSPIVAQARFITFALYCGWCGCASYPQFTLLEKKKSKTNQQKNKPKRKEVEMKELRWYAEYEGNETREKFASNFSSSRGLLWFALVISLSHFKLFLEGMQRLKKSLYGLEWGVRWGGEGKGGRWIRRDLSAILQMCVALFLKFWPFLRPKQITSSPFHTRFHT